MDYSDYFQALIEDVNQHAQSNTSGCYLSYALIQQVNQLIQNTQQTTISGLLLEINDLGEYMIDKLKNHSILNGKSSVFLKSGLAIYKQYLNKNFPNTSEMNLLKQSLFKTGQKYCQKILGFQSSIQKNSLQLMKNGALIMIMGYSKVLEQVLIYASKKGFRFKVLIPNVEVLDEGVRMANSLVHNNIQVTLIPFGSVGFHMDEIDYVMTGAEAVVENGGIINRIGTQLVAMSAHFYKKPVYVVCESFKFTKIFPLTQKDIPDELLYNSNLDQRQQKLEQKVNCINPICDYTEPNLISLLVTDKGIFTPYAVSDELFMIFEQ